MKNIIFAFLGVLFFVAAVVIGYFTQFDSSDVIALALSGFGVVSLVISTYNKKKESGVSWLFWLVIAFAIVGGGLICLGGYSSSIIETVSGLVLALLAVIVSIIAANTKSA